MELTAVIRALEFLTSKLKTKNLKLFLDSSYVLKGATLWLATWKKNGWVGKNKKLILNRELWKKLDKLLKKFEIYPPTFPRSPIHGEKDLRLPPNPGAKSQKIQKGIPELPEMKERIK